MRFSIDREGQASSPPGSEPPVSRVAAFGWRLLALAALALGLVGVVVPGLPTVPFLLLAAWCGGRGWPALEAWLLAHPRYGQTIRQWREHQAISRRAKWAASAMMLLSTVSLFVFSAPTLLRILLPLFLCLVAVWIWRRPDTCL